MKHYFQTGFEIFKAGFFLSILLLLVSCGDRSARPPSSSAEQQKQSQKSSSDHLSEEDLKNLSEDNVPNVHVHKPAIHVHPKRILKLK